jgi:hypothetical protein
MLATVYNSQNVYLLDLAPEWGAGVKARIDLVSDFSTGLTNREGRRPFAKSLRFSSVAFTILVQGKDARRVYGSFRNYQTQPVLCPLWPAQVNWSDRGTATITGALNLVFRPGGQSLAGPGAIWEIYEGAGPVSFVPVASDQVVPLMWGRIEKRSIEWLDAQTIQVAIDFTEGGPASYQITPQPPVPGWATGPRPSDAYSTLPDVLPFSMDWDTVTNDFTTVIRREPIGFGRAPAETLYPQAVAREQQMAYSVLSQDRPSAGIGLH